MRGASGRLGCAERIVGAGTGSSQPVEERETKKRRKEERREALGA